MDTVIRATIVYAILMFLFRLCGTRTMAQVTTFDLVLLLIISEATQQAMVDNDNSITNAALLIVTLIALNIGMSLLKQRSKFMENLLEGVPLVIVADGKPLQERMRKARVDESDVLDAARESRGITHMDQIKYAVLERSGQISIIVK